jgi:hypothetical protein
VRTVTGELTPELLGEALVEHGLISTEQREWALEVTRRTGTRLTVALVASGLVRRLDLYGVLAELSHLPFIDLRETTPEPEVLTGLDVHQMLSDGWVPVRALEDGSVLVAIARLPRSPLVPSIERAIGKPVVLNITSEWDILHALQAGLRDEMLDQAALGLWRRSAEQSARVNLYPRQRIGLVTALVALAVRHAADGERDDLRDLPDRGQLQVRRLHGRRAAGTVPGGHRRRRRRAARR